MNHSGKQRIIILGAAGAGVSNIAQIYHERGFEVIGVDRQMNAATENLGSKSIVVYRESEVEKMDLIQADTIVFRSSAIPDTNPWVVKAVEVGARIMGRPDFFRELSAERRVVAIAGSSGKTSTTGLVAHIFQGHSDAGYLVGIHGNGGHWGSELPFVLEADEYAKTFLYLDQMQTALITNLSYDHVDIYPTQVEYDQAFQTFATTAQASGGKVVIFGDNEQLREVVKDIDHITYGQGLENDWTCRKVENFEGGSRFEVWRREVLMAQVELNIIGGHNIMNALAAFVVAAENEIPIQRIVSQLASFPGLPRRLELLRNDPYFVYDDYAHLPGEIETVLRGVRESFPKRRILCYWQPHTFTRANHFFDQYAEALRQCDLLFLGDVYAARDEGEFDYVRFLSKVTAKETFHSKGVESSRELIAEYLKEGDVLICLNAGTGTQIAHYFAKSHFESKDV